MQRTLTRESLADAFSAGVGSAELVGIEVENGLVDQVTGCSVPYGGEHGARALLELVVREFDGEPLFRLEGRSSTRLSPRPVWFTPSVSPRRISCRLLP